MPRPAVDLGVLGGQLSRKNAAVVQGCVPLVSFKGIDNATYYRPSPEDRRYYMDFTGTGNTLDPTHPSVLRLIMDSLRYFATECHVDGFRFDLAPTLARTFYEVDRLSSFLDAIH